MLDCHALLCLLGSVGQCLPALVVRHAPHSRMQPLVAAGLGSRAHGKQQQQLLQHGHQQGGLVDWSPHWQMPSTRQVLAVLVLVLLAGEWG